MAKHILAVLAAGAALGMIAGLAAGALPGTGTFALVALAGSPAVVLWRSRRDGEELERRLVRVPVHRGVRGQPAGRRSRR